MKTKLMLIVLFFTVLVANSLAQGVAPQKMDLKKYTGRYLFTYEDHSEDVIVELKDGVLVATASIGNASLKFLSDDNFGIPEYGGLVEFTRDENTQKIIGVIVTIPMGDIELEGKKDDKETVVVQK